MHLIMLGRLPQVTKLERDALMISRLHHKNSQGGTGSVSMQPYAKKMCFLKFCMATYTFACGGLIKNTLVMWSQVRLIFLLETLPGVLRAKTCMWSYQPCHCCRWWPGRVLCPLTNIVFRSLQRLWLCESENHRGRYDTLSRSCQQKSNCFPLDMWVEHKYFIDTQSGRERF